MNLSSVINPHEKAPLIGVNNNILPIGEKEGDSPIHWEMEAVRQGVSASSSMQEAREKIDSTAAEPHQVDVVSPSFLEGKKVISDDFPPFTTIGKLFGQYYRSWCNQWETFLEPKLSSKTISPDALLTKRHGFTGLSNHHDTCYLNAALQQITEVLKIVFQKRSSTERRALNEALMTRMPSLLNLMNQELNTEADCQKLYREVAHELASDLWYSWNTRSGIGSVQLQTGYRKTGFPVKYFLVLLHQLGVKPIYLAPSHGNNKKIYHSQQFLSLRTEKLHESVPPYVSPLIRNSTNSAQAALTKVSTPLLSVQERIMEVLQQKNLLVVEPLPAVLVITSINSSTHILDAITLPCVEKNSNVYEAKVVNVSTKGHTYVFIKKNGSWYEVNDQWVFLIPKEWEQDLEKYCEQHARALTFEKKEISSPELSLKATDQLFSEQSPLLVPEQNIMTIIDELEGAWGLKSYFFSSEEQIQEAIGDNYNYSFFLHQLRELINSASSSTPRAHQE
ncbi:MAG: hypothetical protein ACOYK6_04090 [Chthoniobacterales bacterium]